MARAGERGELYDIQIDEEELLTFFFVINANILNLEISFITLIFSVSYHYINALYQLIILMLFLY